MRFDIHCHTREGSPDGQIPLADYVTILKKKGYQGLLITDHNSYRAYRYYEKRRNEPVFADFTVLKGIEYDTIDAGHFLVIMPKACKLPVLELRGLTLPVLIEIVHFFGGILGPAHPCGEKYLSFCNTRRFRKSPELFQSFDFLEAFNACESPASNHAATELARRYRLPALGGSDAHRLDCVGLGYTALAGHIATESDFITCIRHAKFLMNRTVSAHRTDASAEAAPTAAVMSGGTYYHGTTKERIGALNSLLLYAFWVYNRSAGLLRYYRRRREVTHFRRTAGH